MHITPEGMISVALMITTLAIAATSILGIWGLTRGAPIMLLGILAVPMVFMMSLNVPKFSKSSRAGAFDNELPFVMGFMVVLAGGGVSPLGTLRRIADINLFPAAVKEAKRILVDIEIFGMDPITALERAAKYVPNKFFSEFLYGYTTILKTGGSIVSYLNTKLGEVFELRAAKMRGASATTGTLAEGYIAVTALLGITLFTLFQVQALISGGGGGGLESISLFSFIVVPMLSVMFIWILDNVSPKQPYVDMVPYKILAAFLPVGVAIYFIPLRIPGYLHISIALIAMMVVPTIVAMRHSRERRGLEKMLPEFIQDIAESRKIGLPPEKSIELLASKNYRRLSKHVQKMGVQLSWGVTLNRVIKTFSSSARSWLTKVVGTLIAEGVDVGGGTMSSFVNMANFTRKINDMESERSSSMKPFLFIIYMSGLMVILTTFLMTYFLNQPMTTGYSPVATSSKAQAGAMVDQLLVASIFETWVIGFVAGKMGEGVVSDGFKHSLVLVVMSVACVYVARFFIPIPI